MNSKARIKTNPSPRVLRELETDHVEGMIRSTFVTYPEEGAEVVAALTQLVQRHRPVGPHQTVFTVVDAVETFFIRMEQEDTASIIDSTQPETGRNHLSYKTRIFF